VNRYLKKLPALIGIFIIFTACAPDNEKVLFEQASAIDARPFLTESELFRSVTESFEEGPGKPVRALVVPHHAAAAALAAEAISRAAADPPASVIVLAPNHYNEGPAAASTKLDFLSHGTRVSADMAAIDRLLNQGLIKLNDELFIREHSVGMLVPLISWYLPEAEIIPVIFHHGYDEYKIIEIIEALKPETDAGAVILASIDFSHHLTRDEAIEKDIKMREYLERGDARTITGLDSSYIDAPTVMSALLLHFGTDDMEIITNTNSGILMQNPITPCTSYFTIQF